MVLHQALAELARDHGHGLFRDASAFRGSLDDYLDEGQASSGTINLLTDAVRLGALDGMLTMLDSGAAPADAVDSAGQRLARDRGSADVRGCQWAVAVLGFALGRVPENLVTGLDPEAHTAAPPHHGPGGTTPVQYPVQSPPHQPFAGPGYAPAGQPSYPGGWSQPPASKKSSAGLVIGAIAVAVVVIVAGIVGIVLLANGGGEDPSADETSETVDLGGITIKGQGYQVQAPEGWSDGTEEFVKNNPGLTTLDKVVLWGDTFNTARANIIVETQSSYGATDPNDLKDAWKEALVSGDPTADVTDIPNVAIDGQTALGVEISRTNDSGVKVKQRSHLVISGELGYSITVSLKDGDEKVLPQFEEILTTWEWSE
ncbi:MULTISPECIES: hypothetical protein [Nocardioides]|uniref:Uncharacterized protein n=1 Tax=Nocardioides vastitatis TaxID=2568655 RepID=A0ABW0ZGM7_9ACTN|nr:hypothetical protein [Nocardioides sp.]THI95537.1 hypothetical protein E7Z54_18975 [Nocardioides sp.]